MQINANTEVPMIFAFLQSYSTDVFNIKYEVYEKRRINDVCNGLG